MVHYWIHKDPKTNIEKKFLSDYLKQKGFETIQDVLKLPVNEKNKFFKEFDEKLRSYMTSASIKENTMELKTAAANYFKFMLKKLKEMHGKDKKSPFQLEKKDQKSFFKKIKEEWKAEKEKSEKKAAEDTLEAPVKTKVKNLLDPSLVKKIKDIKKKLVKKD